MSMRRENSQYFSPEKKEQLTTGDIELGEEGLNGLLKPCALFCAIHVIKIYLWSQRVVGFVRDL